MKVTYCERFTIGALGHGVQPAGGQTNEVALLGIKVNESRVRRPKWLVVVGVSADLDPILFGGGRSFSDWRNEHRLHRLRDHQLEDEPAPVRRQDAVVDCIFGMRGQW